MASVHSSIHFIGDGLVVYPHPYSVMAVIASGDSRVTFGVEHLQSLRELVAALEVKAGIPSERPDQTPANTLNGEIDDVVDRLDLGELTVWPRGLSHDYAVLDLGGLEADGVSVVKPTGDMDRHHEAAVTFEPVALIGTKVVFRIKVDRIEAKD